MLFTFFFNVGILVVIKESKKNKSPRNSLCRITVTPVLQDLGKHQVCNLLVLSMNFSMDLR